MTEPVYPYVPPFPSPDRPHPPARLDAPAGPDLWNDWARASLFEQRTVLLHGSLDDDIATRAASELMLLETASDEPIVMRIDCRSGAIGAALALIDVLDLLAVPVHATCIGRAEGPALGVLAVADQRTAAPHAVLRFGAEVAVFDGRAGEVVEAAVHHQAQVAQFATRVAAASTTDVSTIESLIRQQTRLSNDDAIALGLLDGTAEREARVLRIPRQVGYRARH